MKTVKIDKWKELLQQAEAAHSKRVTQLESLQQEQVWLLKREELLLSMIHGLGAISNCILQRERAKWAALGPDATPQMQQLLTAVQQQEQEISRQLDLVSCVQTPGWEQQHNESLAMMGRLFDPQYVQQVLAMPLDAVIAKLCVLAGKCAIKVFQEPSAADFFQHSTADFDQMADPVMQACAAAAAAVGGSPVAGCGAASEPGMSGHDLSGMWDQELLQDPYIQQCAAAAPADAGSGNGSSSGLLYIPNNAAPAAPPAAHAAATGASSQYGSGVSSAANNTGDVAYFEPAMEFCSIMLTFMLFDDERFPVLANTNLETGDFHMRLPGSFWLLVEKKLELTAEQVMAFQHLEELYFGGLTRIGQQLQVTTMQQEASTQELQELYKQQGEQEEVISRPATLPTQLVQEVSRVSLAQQQAHRAAQAQQGCQPRQSSRAAKVQRLQDEQVEGLKTQTKLVRGWKLMALRLGLATLTTLTPRQSALFIAASFPLSPRMDLLLAAIADRARAEEQARKQEVVQAQQQQRHRS